MPVPGASPGIGMRQGRRRWLVLVPATLLVAILAGELAFSIRHQSQIGDEACHIFAGYRYWTHGDFGLNPEHPPLVKLVAALPLLALPLDAPPLAEGSSKADCFFGAARFLYANDADRMLFRARMAASVFTLLLAVLVFIATDRLFGTGPAFLALALLTFEPNLLAHGALVTTDAGATWGMFAAVYMFYRYVERPSVPRLLAGGLAVGLALVTKHSSALIVPILALLAIVEVVRARAPGRTIKRAVRMSAALVVIGAVSLAVIWGAYAFRFEARPEPRELNPTLAEFMPGDSWQGALILDLAARRALPESYLYGLADVALISSTSRPMFLFGTVYPSARWFYFGAAFLVKSTLPLLLLLVVVPFARLGWSREVLFVVIPPAAFFVLMSATSGLNIGVRHVLPAFPFLIVLAAAAAWSLAARWRAWRYVLALLLVFHVISSLRAFPDYLPYSNELWGGPGRTYKALSDSNVDWGQGLKATSEYLRRRGVRDCWFAYFPRVVVDPAYYGIPCRSLPTFFMKVTNPEKLATVPVPPVPETIQGLVVIGATELSGTLWGPGELNPYAQFLEARPADVIAGSVLAFEGTFDGRSLAAESHAIRAIQHVGRGEHAQAVDEARSAVELAPRSASHHFFLARLLSDRAPEEACREYRTAFVLTETVHPDYQRDLRALIPGRCAGVSAGGPRTP